MIQFSLKGILLGRDHNSNIKHWISLYTADVGLSPNWKTLACNVLTWDVRAPGAEQSSWFLQSCITTHLLTFFFAAAKTPYGHVLPQRFKPVTSKQQAPGLTVWPTARDNSSSHTEVYFSGFYLVFFAGIFAKSEAKSPDNHFTCMLTLLACSKIRLVREQCMSSILQRLKKEMFEHWIWIVKHIE